MGKIPVRDCRCDAFFLADIYTCSSTTEGAQYIKVILFTLWPGYDVQSWTTELSCSNQKATCIFRHQHCKLTHINIHCFNTLHCLLCMLTLSKKGTKCLHFPPFKHFQHWICPYKRWIHCRIFPYKPLLSALNPFFTNLGLHRWIFPPIRRFEYWICSHKPWILSSNLSTQA